MLAIPMLIYIFATPQVLDIFEWMSFFLHVQKIFGSFFSSSEWRLPKRGEKKEDG